MNTILGPLSAALLWILAPPVQNGQTPNTPPVQFSAADKNTHVTNNVVEGHIMAVNYRVRGGPTKIDFIGTSLMPGAKGSAWIESKKGYIEIDASFDKLQQAKTFGPEYLTYILWAITPEGRATNLGEVVLSNREDHDAKLHVTTELQSFGLVVTAEPYFAVVRPSDVMVLQNVIRKDTEGNIQEIEATFNLLKKGEYTSASSSTKPAEITPCCDPNNKKSVKITVEPEVPSSLAQARNAVRIASAYGAERFASDTMQKASTLLAQAESEHTIGSEKTSSTLARQAVQTAEDARLVSLRRMGEIWLIVQRAALEEAALQALAEQEAQLRAEAEKARTEAEAAERFRMEEEKRALNEKAAAAQREAERARAEAMRLIDETSRQSAMQAEEMRLATLRMEQDRAELRANLMRQLNLVLVTRDTARGLIVDLADVRFDTARYTIRPDDREKLAKISGILLTQPDLTLEIEGHTDDVGSTEYNQTLSEERAGSVKDFLVQQGIPPARITAKGFGESQPVASNDTAEGRQLNRRVDMIVSGGAIGTPAAAGIQ
jgi:outer membrane protein OmpA-like peptidoglycan-associated protein